ncbi:mannose-6-phosphate isomerase, class I [Niallia nealsonii]|uniref:Mannose-6-phosphate isomerase n=1 Tax=Niallia nealsonii TaxID=115979 RepID=A0A2N0Z0X1_9BACI|nr:mannose-6-phosphate isomerase, class I [Niallia nealsonii]PKG23162.1 mannose-6-phosphate isomerase, class I [Niallia nealsonii]
MSLSIPLFLKPVFKERIWGGSALKDQFGYSILSNKTGECWAISAHPNGPSIIENGPYKGKTLSELWGNQPELFGHYDSEKFPLLTKILDANSDLSVQVHPDDVYAGKYENGELGKTECWYIIDCKENAELVYGHHAKSKEEFAELIKEGKWNKLLQKVSIKPGDFFYVPSGTIHALCEGTLVLETQQSSDTTYRVYDYDRTDETGKKRELHLQKAMDVSTVPHEDADTQFEITKSNASVITTFVKENYFTVYKWEINGRTDFSQELPFQLVSVIKGEGILTINNEMYPINKGTHFILPSNVKQFSIDGDVTAIVSHP